MENLLKRVRPYHEVDARHRGGVYHDRADCPAGQRLYSDHLASGTAGLARCDQCRVLDQAAPEPSDG